MNDPDPAPLILTLALAPADQARFDHLRTAHFPAERNYLDAHVSLFHHLPGDEASAIAATLAIAAGARAPFAIAVTGLRSLGRGTAFTLAAPELARLRAELAALWAAALTAQDWQGFRPHITIQNKVDPAAARALLSQLSRDFAPFEVTATGLALWRYRGGPWEKEGDFAFTGPPAAPPGSRHR